MSGHPLVTTLLGRPGRYAGRGDGTESGPFVGRIVVTALPSGRGVSIDYEAWSEAELLQHAEHSVLAHGPDGTVTLVVAHSEAPVLSIMVEQEPGWFVAPPDRAPYGRGIKVEIPERDRLIYSWWWAPPGEPLVERSRADLRRL